MLAFDDVLGGRVYLVGSGRVTLGVAGNARGLIANPAASGVHLRIARLAVFATATGYATLFIDPTVGLPPINLTPRNALVGGSAGAGTAGFDTNATTALSGGTDTGIVLGIPASRRTEIDLPPLVLPPGVSLGINIPFAGAADMAATVYWTEE